jgi:hypothetical protein
MAVKSVGERAPAGVTTHLIDPIAVSIRTRRPEDPAISGHFTSTDPLPGLDLARIPRVARLLASRRLQFFMILPNQIIFWLVIGIGLLGTVDPGLNFATAITWYLWFCLVFVMMVVAGRAWCAMCPFGGFGEWVQRHTFWNRSMSNIGLGLKLPEKVAQYGYLLSVGTFLALTWVEEYFNIAGPGNPASTSFMVLGIVGSALTSFGPGGIGRSNGLGRRIPRTRPQRLSELSNQGVHAWRRRRLRLRLVHVAGQLGLESFLRTVHRVLQGMPQRQHRPLPPKAVDVGRRSHAAPS